MVKGMFVLYTLSESAHSAQEGAYAQSQIRAAAPKMRAKQYREALALSHYL
jgi:hypothetical protein